MKAMHRTSHPKPRFLLLELGRLFLNISFKCKLSAVVETDVHKKSTSAVMFDTVLNQADFNQQLRLRVRSTQNSPLSITVVIIKGSNKKKVGVVRMELSERSGGKAKTKYAVGNCPQEDVFFEIGYKWESENYAAQRFVGNWKRILNGEYSINKWCVKDEFKMRIIE